MYTYLQSLTNARQVNRCNVLPCSQDFKNSDDHRTSSQSDEILGREILFSAPLTIQWDLTKLCNLFCRHCYADASTTNRYIELTCAQSVRVVDEAAKIGVLAFHFLGGEPFMRQDCIEIVQHACHLGINCHISTNGTLIHSQHARALKELSDVTIDVSLDSVNEEKHDWLRGKKGSYQEAIECMHLLHAHNIRMGTTCTIYPATIDEMTSIAQQAYSLGAMRLQFLYVSLVGRAQQHGAKLLLGEKQKKIFEEQVKFLKSEFKNRMVIDSPIVNLNPENIVDKSDISSDFWITGCLAGIDKMAIHSDGSVVACPQLGHSYGFIQDSTLQEIWLKLHTERISKLGLGCEIHPFNGICGGGCPAIGSYVNEVATCFSRNPNNIEYSAINPAEYEASLKCRFLQPPKPLPCVLPIIGPDPARRPSPCLAPCSMPNPSRCSAPCAQPNPRCPLPCSIPTPCLCPHPCSLPGK